MTLGNLLEALDENRNVTVIERSTDMPLAWYDGKNSIPSSLNSCDVAKIDYDNDGFNVLVERR